jgi:uncharacterized RDD family membrane protein YckC
MYGHFTEEVRAMNIELQKANMWKRISAGLFDGILLAMLAVGLAFLLSVVLGYDGHTAQLEARYAEYEARYGITLDITSADYDAMTEEEREQYDAALAAFAEDREAGYLYSLLINLTLVIITFGILLSYLILELIVPLLFGNGQTVGKKVFGIGVMHVNALKITPQMLFIRTVLGKYTLETMIPVLLILMIFFGIIGIEGTAIILVLALVQVVLLAATRTRSAIHDLLAQSVTVDLASQMIFENAEARMNYIKNRAAEEAARAEK